MTPETDHLLRTSFGTILTDVAPHIAHDYAGGSVTLIGLLMLFAAEDFERGADVRARENGAMRTLFADAARALPRGSLRDAVAAAAVTRDADLAISTLNASNAALKTVLIDLHAYVEDWHDPAASALDGRIWAILRQFADGRALTMPAL